MKNTQTKVPSFTGLRPSNAASTKSKRANTASDTRPEIALRRTVWQLGLRYRKNVKTIFGRPDMAFVIERVAVFCDGDFWHGRDWSAKQDALRKGWNSEYWVAKISRNIERDKEVNQHLTTAGWKVLRYWESDVLKSPARIASDIEFVVLQRRHSSIKNANSENKKPSK